MANVNIICIGKLKEKYLKEAQAEYTKRLSAFCRINVIEKKESALPKNASSAEIDKAVMQESSSLLQSSSGFKIALSPEGKTMSSESFADLIKTQSQKGDVSFFIGGSCGLSKDIKSQSNLMLSFSAMTMPHQLFRVVLLEQIYRAFMINNQRTYHK